MKLGIIGYGKMAQAIIKGLIKNEYLKACDIYASARNMNKLVINCNETSINPCNTKKVILKSDYIILGVKPYQVEEILKTYQDILKDKIIISICNGILFDEIERIHEGFKHISVLPNINVEISKGIVLFENKHNLDETEYNEVYNLFDSIAFNNVVDREHFEIATVLSGCTPAYIAMFLEALGDAGVKNGLSREDAYKIAAKSLEGTACLYLEKGIHPGIMKDMVTSPGGTTIKGIASLEKDGFRGNIIQAIDSVIKNNC